MVTFTPKNPDGYGYGITTCLKVNAGPGSVNFIGWTFTDGVRWWAMKRNGWWAAVSFATKDQAATWLTLHRTHSGRCGLNLH